MKCQMSGNQDLFLTTWGIYISYQVDLHPQWGPHHPKGKTPNFLIIWFATSLLSLCRFSNPKTEYGLEFHKWFCLIRGCQVVSDRTSPKSNQMSVYNPQHNQNSLVFLRESRLPAYLFVFCEMRVYWCYIIDALEKLFVSFLQCKKHTR